MLWPLAPQQSPHEVIATVGEVRGSFDSKDSRESPAQRTRCRRRGTANCSRRCALRRLLGPIANWGFGDLNEGLHVGVFSYIHMHVGRDKDDKVFDDPRFMQVKDTSGKLVHMRVRRGARFKPGQALGTINRMLPRAHERGSSGSRDQSAHALTDRFKDKVDPVIERDGIHYLTSRVRHLPKNKRGVCLSMEE